MHKSRDQFIGGLWLTGEGAAFASVNPATGVTVWQGNAASSAQVDKALRSARTVLGEWMSFSLEERSGYLRKFIAKLTAQQDELASVLAQETGKPLWEAKTEITAMIGKFDVSKAAFADRCKELTKDMQGVTSITRHKPHGVMLVLGPFNFPGHLPNGHIIPALLAGNTVVFKSSELTPQFSVKMFECWQAAELPTGVINLLQGDGSIGKQLVQHQDIDGILFTGSFATGASIQVASLPFPKRILALEMGGNNPLVVYKPDNIDAAVYHTIQSAFITAGQRCSCARRLIVVKDPQGENFVQRLIAVTKEIQVGTYTDNPEPFMGPVISKQAADKIQSGYQGWLSLGAKVLVPMQRLNPELAFLSPSIIDCTGISNAPDEEIFGPLLRLIWVHDFNAAIKEANNTSYGLTAGLLGANPNLYQEFFQDIRAGVVNWNRPTTGASSSAPFGGVGRSGNYRPSAYYAADYCSYPVASMEDNKLQLPSILSPGITL